MVRIARVPTFSGVLVSAQTKRYLAISEAATIFDVHHSTVRRWISQGRITGYRLGPRMLRVDLNEIESMLRPLATANRGASA